VKKKTAIVLLKYGITILFSALLAWTVLRLRSYSGQEELVEKYRMLCDAFTFPGVLLMLLAALIALSQEGAFLGLGYVVRYAMRFLIPGLAGKHETYAEYVESKTEKPRIKGYGFIFYIGAAFFFIALVFLALFFAAYSAAD
jgi:hypothetical protein